MHFSLTALYASPLCSSYWFPLPPCIHNISTFFMLTSPSLVWIIYQCFSCFLLITDISMPYILTSHSRLWLLLVSHVHLDFHCHRSCAYVSALLICLSFATANPLVTYCHWFSLSSTVPHILHVMLLSLLGCYDHFHAIVITFRPIVTPSMLL